METDNNQIERLVHSLDKVYGSTGQIVKRGFLIGLASGIGGVIGAALVILLLGYLVNKLGWVPFFGKILEKINQAIPN
jgi:hypothetical protein